MDWWTYTLALTGITVLFSLFFQGQKKHLIALVLLSLSAFLLRLVIIDLDPFLHPWDERFHALVAKNLIDHPLVPTLRENPITPYDYKDWASNHIWLHKQPLFLWQMALSMAIFGKTVFAARIPSAIMGAIMVFFIYRIGRNLKSPNAGYFAALLWAFCFYSLLLAMGVQTNDHNDMSFCFYVTGAIWAFSEYSSKPSWKWSVIIGLFAGCAVLVKWLTGMIIYGGWGIAVLITPFWRKKLSSYLHIMLALFVSVTIFLPWQIYIFTKYPKIAEHEFELNRRHIYEVVEGHSGNWDYYLGSLDIYLGEHLWILMVIGLGCLFLLNTRKQLVWAILFHLIVSLAFFSTIPTKLPSYIFLVVPQMLIITGVGLDFIWCRFSTLLPYNTIKKILFLIIGLVLGLHILRPSAINNYYTKNESPPKFILSNRDRLNHNCQIFKRLDSATKKGTYIMGAVKWSYINAMFHSNTRVVRGVPSPEVLRDLKEKEVPLATFQNAPDSIKQDPEIKPLPYKLK